jgi:integrase
VVAAFLEKCVIIYKKYELFKEKIRTMANKETVAVTAEQYKEIIDTMRSGGAGFRANNRIATILILQANLGLRIQDILGLHLSDIVKDGSHYRLDIVEDKSEKKRTFLVPLEIYQFIRLYCQDNVIGKNDIIFPITVRAVEKYLDKVAKYLGMEKIGTHSFRKFYASSIYEDNNHDIELVRELLQHSSTVTTQRYIKRSSRQVEDAIRKHIYIV